MCGPPEPEMRSPAAANGRAKSQHKIEPHQPTEAAAGLQGVFGRRVIVIREPIGKRFRTRAPR
jgi:hypothetical protein